MLGVLLGCLDSKHQLEKNNSLKSILAVSEVLLELIESDEFNHSDANLEELLENRVNQKLMKYSLSKECFDVNTGCILAYSLMKDFDLTKSLILSLGKIYQQNVELGIVLSKIFNLIDIGTDSEDIFDIDIIKQIMFNENIAYIFEKMNQCDDFEQILDYTKDDQVDSKTVCILCAIAEAYFGIPENDILSIYELLDEDLLNIVERYYVAVFNTHDMLEQLEFTIERSIENSNHSYDSIINYIIEDLIRNKEKIYVITDSSKNNHYNFYLKAHNECGKHYYFCYTGLNQIRSFDKKDIMTISIENLIEILMADPAGEALVINPELQGYVLKRTSLMEILDSLEFENIIN